MKRFFPIVVLLAACVALAQPQPRPPVHLVQPPGASQPSAPGQRAPEALPQLSISPEPKEVRKIEYASNGFIEVAHALILVPKVEDTLARALQLAQAAVSRAFKARPSLSEVDTSVYQAESFDGIGGPLPRFTASVPKNRLTAFMALERDTVTAFDRAWVNPSSLASAPKRQPNTDREHALTFHGSAQDLASQRVKQLAAQTSGGARGGLLFQGDPKRAFAALTFDDAPHPLFEPLLLDTLRRAGVKATFFCIGRNAKAYPYFVRDMIEQGHEVANHTYHHVRLPTLEDRDVRDELEMANQTLQDITGQPVRYFRPPGGEYSKATLRIAQALGLTTVFWTDDPADFDNLGGAVIENKLLRHLRPGGIVLLHDNVMDTINVLGGFLQAANRRGMALGTVNALSDPGGG